MSLRLDFCSRETATFAVKTRHYSRSMPSGRLVCIGVWEFLLFVGAVIFGRGASSEIGSPFGLPQSEVCELCRVALGPHTAPTSQIVSIAVRLLRRHCPGLRLIVSYADPEHGHVGTLYQAMGWSYLGTTNRESLIRLNGRLLHPRTVASRYHMRSIDWLRLHIDADAGHARTLPKHRYVLPLDAAMRAQLVPRLQPYPKAVVECDRGVDSAHAGRGAGFCLLAPAATSTREEAGAIPDPVAPHGHEVAHVV
jgi:hypothetical protein